MNRLTYEKKGQAYVDIGLKENNNPTSLTALQSPKMAVIGKPSKSGTTSTHTSKSGSRPQTSKYLQNLMRPTLASKNKIKYQASQQ